MRILDDSHFIYAAQQMHLQTNKNHKNKELNKMEGKNASQGIFFFGKEL